MLSISGVLTEAAQIETEPQAENIVISTDNGNSDVGRGPERPHSGQAGAVTLKNHARKHSSGGWRKFLDQFDINDNVQRTCEEALSGALASKSVIIDLSNTTDFQQNGERVLATIYGELIKTNAFGTNSPNLYVDLSNTNISPELIGKLMQQFKKDGKIVVLSLSNNVNLGDECIDVILPYLDSVCSLNLSGTKVTDAGLSKIISHIGTDGIGHLRHITISGADVTLAGVTELRTSMQNAMSMSGNDQKGQVYALKGESGVTYRKVIKAPQRRKHSDKNGEAIQQVAVQQEVVQPAFPAVAAVETAVVQPAFPAVAAEETAVAPAENTVVPTEEIAETITPAVATIENTIASIDEATVPAEVAVVPTEEIAEAAAPVIEEPVSTVPEVETTDPNVEATYVVSDGSSAPLLKSKKAASRRAARRTAESAELEEDLDDGLDDSIIQPVIDAVEEGVGEVKKEVNQVRQKALNRVNRIKRGINLITR
jgi:hypothetical protein